MAFRITVELTVVTAVAVFAAWGAPAAKEQTKAAEGNVQAGRALALLVCAGCHVVAPDQPFKPVYQGPPNPPDFKEIANEPGVTAESLRHHLETLPAVARNSMPNLLLSDDQLRDVAAYVISLRAQPLPPSR
jgi:mono/diheme cytochrome c family protein